MIHLFHLSMTGYFEGDLSKLKVVFPYVEPNSKIDAELSLMKCHFPDKVCFFQYLSMEIRSNGSALKIVGPFSDISISSITSSSSS